MINSANVYYASSSLFSQLISFLLYILHTVTAPTSTTTQRWATVSTPTPATPSIGSGDGTDIESSGNGVTDDGGRATDIGGGAVDLGSGDSSVD